VEATIGESGMPQAALIGVAFSDSLEIVFDTIETSRKVVALRASPKIALVIGWDDERTVQIEGVADEPRGVELERLKHVYFAAFPDGPQRQAWPGITYVRVRPTWIRYSDFRTAPPVIVEITP
jgi:pyridoxine/pyridoxamine 5'-phosphate oxidase